MLKNVIFWVSWSGIFLLAIGVMVMRFKHPELTEMEIVIKLKYFFYTSPLLIIGIYWSINSENPWR